MNVVVTSPTLDFLSRIQAWAGWEDIGHVAQKEYDISQAAFEQALPEYQKFLALLKFHFGLGIFSEQVDKIWHAHILYSTLYESFCHKYFGYYVHHVPNLGSLGATWRKSEEVGAHQCPGSSETPPKGRSQEQQARDFQKAYQMVFGPLPALWNLSESGGSAF
jgi:hypothetical protein